MLTLDTLWDRTWLSTKPKLVYRILSSKLSSTINVLNPLLTAHVWKLFLLHQSSSSCSCSCYIVRICSSSLWEFFYYLFVQLPTLIIFFFCLVTRAIRTSLYVKATNWLNILLKNVQSHYKYNIVLYLKTIELEQALLYSLLAEMTSPNGWYEKQDVHHQIEKYWVK